MTFPTAFVMKPLIMKSLVCSFIVALITISMSIEHSPGAVIKRCVDGDFFIKENLLKVICIMEGNFLVFLPAFEMSSLFFPVSASVFLSCLFPRPLFSVLLFLLPVFLFFFSILIGIFSSSPSLNERVFVFNMARNRSTWEGMLKEGKKRCILYTHRFMSDSAKRGETIFGSVKILEGK